MSGSAVGLPSGPGPPSYSEARRTSCMPTGVTSVDFAPRCVDDGGILTSVKYERFDLLVARANAWMRAHPCIGVRCCETVEYRSNVCQYGAAVDTSTVLLTNAPRSAAHTFLVLRLWIYIKDDSSPHLVAYLNVVPACLHPGGVLSKPRFDLLHNVVHKLNAMLKRRPVPGKILNVDTVHTRLRQYSEWVEPDRCHWRHHSEVGVAVLTFLRVFYQPGPGQQVPGTLRFKDFPPLMRGGHDERWEEQGEVMERLQAWLTSHNPQHIINMETIQRRVKIIKGRCRHESTVNTLGDSWRPCQLVRVTRMWYVERSRDLDILPPQPPSVSHHGGHALLCRDFFPPSTPGRGHHLTQYECLMETLARLEQWQQENKDVTVMSAETCHVGLDTSLQRLRGTEHSAASYTSKEESHTTLAFIRVFYYKPPVGPPPDYPVDAPADPPPGHSGYTPAEPMPGQPVETLTDTLPQETPAEPLPDHPLHTPTEPPPGHPVDTPAETLPDHLLDTPAEPLPADPLHTLESLLSQPENSLANPVAGSSADHT